MENLEHLEIKLDSVTLHAVAAGPKDGPPLILLHGFPDFWYGWRHQIEPLSKAGYRVLAPDMRGYNLSDKPSNRQDYGMEQLGQDLVGLVRFTGHPKASVVGHDWGGGVLWWALDAHSEHIERAVIINVPHTRVLQSALRSDMGQLRRSWYMLFFQLPRLPEMRLLGRRAQNLLDSIGVHFERSQDFEDPEVREAYRDAWLQPGAMTAMLNYYRAALRNPPPRPTTSPQQVPTLLIWGQRDRALGPKLALASQKRAPHIELAQLDDCGHFPHVDDPQKVNALLLDFLSRQ